MPPKRDLGKQKQVDRSHDITGKISTRKGPQDLTIRARQQAEESEIPTPPSRRDTTQDAYTRSCMGFFIRMFGCHVTTEKPNATTEEPNSFVLKLKGSRTNLSGDRRRTTDTSVPPESLDLNAVATRRRLLRDAQINIWNRHLDEEDVANLMKTGEVIRVSEPMSISEGATQPRKITLDNGITGIYKSRRNDVYFPAGSVRAESKYESEIAAYKIAQLLGGVRVPLTVEREIDGEKGSLQLWVNGLKQPTQEYSGLRRVDDLGSPETMNSDQSQDSVGSPEPSDHPQKTHYPNNIAFFDYLISHYDRKDINNWGYAPDNMPVLFDNADAFQKKQPMIFSRKITQFIPDKSILDNARELDMEKLKGIGELSEEQKKDFLARRDKLIPKFGPN